MHTYIVIDTETSGVDLGESEVIALAAVSSVEGMEPFHAYILPTKPVPEGAAKVNGYSAEAWERFDAMPLKHALIGFRYWLEKQGAPQLLRPVAHNAGFDRAMLQAAERAAGISCGLTHRWRCSQALLMAVRDAGLLPEGFANLDALGEVSGFWQKEARATFHDALQDARCALHGYQYLLRLIRPDARPTSGGAVSTATY